MEDVIWVVHLYSWGVIFLPYLFLLQGVDFHKILTPIYFFGSHDN
jgi:hypothetical protein